MANVEEICLTGLSMSHFEAIGALKNLKKLQMNFLDAPGSKINEGLRQLNLSKLKHIEAKNFSMSSENLLEICRQNFHNLSYLDLSNAGGGVVTDQVLQEICCNMINLVHLDLSGNDLSNATMELSDSTNAPTSEFRRMSSLANLKRLKFLGLE